MGAVEAILLEVEKLKPGEKLQLLHQLVDRMMATYTPTSSVPDFDKYIGIGKGVWEVDAQTYVNESRNN